MRVAVDAAHWWGPVGWSYRNLVANLVASGLCVAAAAFKVRAEWVRHRAHELWVAQHVAAIHQASTGQPASPHPQHGNLTA